MTLAGRVTSWRSGDFGGDKKDNQQPEGRKQMKKVLMMAAVCLIAWVASSDGDKAKAGKVKSVLSKERIEYAVEYDRLKSGLLGKLGDDMGEVEALQAIAVQFSRAFSKTEERLNKLERSTVSLQDDMDKVRQWSQSVNGQIDDHEKRIKTLEGQIKIHDEDMTKLFDWSNVVEDELHSTIKIGGIRSDVESLKKNLRNASELINGLDKDVSNNAAAIRDLAAAINSLRYR